MWSRKLVSILALLAILAPGVSVVPSNAEASGTARLGKSFSQLQNQSSGWSLTYQPGSKEYWRTQTGLGKDYANINESGVFFGSLTHNDTAELRDWQLRIGQGSQIYSIITPFGEAISSQAYDCEQHWNDSVLQVFFRPPGDRKDHEDCGVEIYDKNRDIHQAGTYWADTRTDASYFSPMLQSSNTGNTVSTIVWPQASHIPTRYESAMTVHQTVTDLGDGVVRVELSSFNDSEAQVESFLWSEFNAALFDSLDSLDAVPKIHPFLWTSRTTGNGGIRQERCAVEFGCVAPRDRWQGSDLVDTDHWSDFGGFVALARPLRANSDRSKPGHNWGMVIVAGLEMSKLQLGLSAGRGITFSGSLPDIPAGQLQTYTYYLVFGQLNLAFTQAKALTATVTTGPPPSSAGTNVICAGSLRGRGWDSCTVNGGSGGITRGSMYTEPVIRSGITSAPIFVLERPNENGPGFEHLVTADPYARTTDFTAAESHPSGPVMRPYSGPATQRQFLGYGFTQNPGGCFQRLEDLPGVPLANMQIEGTIYVRPNGCNG